MKREKSTKEISLEWDDFDIENLIETLRKHAVNVDNAVVFDEMGDVCDFTDNFTDSIEEAEVNGERFFEQGNTSGDPEDCYPDEFNTCLYSVNIKFDGRKINLLESMQRSGLERLESELFSHWGDSDW
jgi:hypothetical protein